MASKVKAYKTECGTLFEDEKEAHLYEAHVRLLSLIETVTFEKDGKLNKIELFNFIVKYSGTLGPSTMVISSKLMKGEKKCGLHSAIRRRRDKLCQE